MGEDAPHIDSRYSPIYQRGGTGSSSTGAPAGAVGHPDHGSASPRPQAQGRIRPDEPASVAELRPPGSDQSAEPAPTGQSPAKVNPFVVLLWLLGLGLLVLGLWAVFAPLQVEETALTGPFPQWVFIISQSAGGLVVSGSIFLAAAAVLSALTWERRGNRPR